MKTEEIVRLGLAGDHEALERAIPGLSAKTRVGAIQELGKFESPSAVATLLRVATSDTDQACRLAAGRSLKRIGGDAGAEEVLINSLDDPTVIDGAAMTRLLESSPRAIEEFERGKRDIAAGRTVPSDEVR